MDGKRAFAVRVFSTLLVAAWIVSAAMSTRLACAQDADGAKRFVESLYRQYDHHGPGVDFSGAKGRNVFDASLNALMDADAKAVGPNEVGVLDGDPICGCQDWEGIWDLQIALQMLGESRAKAAVSFALFAPKTTSCPRGSRSPVAGDDAEARKQRLAHRQHRRQVGPEGAVRSARRTRKRDPRLETNSTDQVASPLSQKQRFRSQDAGFLSCARNPIHFNAIFKGL